VLVNGQKLCFGSHQLYGNCLLLFLHCCTKCAVRGTAQLVQVGRRRM
jgi:hypothetical protein